MLVFILFYFILLFSRITSIINYWFIKLRSELTLPLSTTNNSKGFLSVIASNFAKLFNKLAFFIIKLFTDRMNIYKKTKTTVGTQTIKNVQTRPYWDASRWLSLQISEDVAIRIYKKRLFLIYYIFIENEQKTSFCGTLGICSLHKMSIKHGAGRE